MTKQRRKVFMVVATLAVVLGGVLLLAFDSVKDVEFYVHVEDVVKEPQKWISKNVIQVHGFAKNVPLKPTIENQSVHRTFNLESKGAMIEVRHEGPVPDTFKEQAETVVKGTLSMEGDKIVLTTIGGEQGIMAKCPSKYSGK